MAEAAELCELGGNSEYAGFVHGNLGFIHIHRGEFDKALAAKEEVLRQMDEHFNLHTYVRIMANTAVALSYLGHWDTATDEVVGVHILGAEAGELIAAAAVAMGMEATVEELARTVQTHPTLAETLKEAAEDYFGLGIHTPARKT